MEWIAEKLADLFRPWHDSGLPEDLEFGEIEAWLFVRGSMARHAELAVRLDVPFGVFGVIGIGYARRAARVWRPRERLLMEDVSCAFWPLHTRAGSGGPAPQVQKDRLAFLLGRYLTHEGTPWPDERVRDGIERFIADRPRDTPDEASG